jgi:hypothetical protein
MVSTSVPPDTTVAEAKAAEDLVGLGGPAVTVIVGLLASATLLTVAVKVLTVPAVVAVKVVV